MQCINISIFQANIFLCHMSLDILLFWGIKTPSKKTLSLVQSTLRSCFYLLTPSVRSQPNGIWRFAISLHSPPHLLALLQSARVHFTLSGCTGMSAGKGRLQVPLAPNAAVDPPLQFTPLGFALLRFTLGYSTTGLVRVRSAHTLFSPFRPPLAPLCVLYRVEETKCYRG